VVRIARRGGCLPAATAIPLDTVRSVIRRVSGHVLLVTATLAMSLPAQDAAAQAPERRGAADPAHAGGAPRSDGALHNESLPFAALSRSAQRLRGSFAAGVGATVEGLWRPVTPVVDASVRDSIAARARAQVGARYRLGAESPSLGFDCSGLVRFVLSMFRLDVPRTARTQALAGRAVERDTARLRPGDLLTFGPGNRVTHVGIYVGNGRFVHASTSRQQVVESSIARRGTWFTRHWVGARRLIATADSAG
jgi:cell wall-associated NlpC family hydrolase